MLLQVERFLLTGPKQNMTQTNQTYIEEKAQEIVEISQGHFVDYEWIDEDGTKGFSKAIPISFYKKWLRVALQDAIKYGEGIGREERDKEIARHLENTVMQHVTPEMEDKQLAIKMLKNIIDILKRAKLTTSEGEGKNFENLM